MVNELAMAVQEARSNGWAVGQASLLDIKSEGEALEWRKVRNRKTAPTVQTVTPVAVAAAASRSLSATTGLGPQPLHTDGAHHAVPPRWLLLYADDVSRVPTGLWPGRTFTRIAYFSEALRYGLFFVSGGDFRGFSVVESAGTFRYDPGCMEPADARARLVRDTMATMEATHLHAWDAPNKFLLIDNQRVLHARGDASDEPDRTLIRIAFDLPKER